MPFRDPTTTAIAVLDPLARFFELEAAFEAGRGFFGDMAPLRLAAANLVLVDGEPTEIVARVRSAAEVIERQRSWFSELTPPLCLLMAAISVQRGDSPESLMHEVARVRAVMRTYGIRRSAAYEAIAILGLRIRNQLAPIRDEQIERLRAIYAAMKRHHYWLTGPEDLPACGFLVNQHDRSPEEIGDRAHAIYEGLRVRANLWRGDPLQSAANMLALSPLEPGELVERFVTLMHGFQRRSVKIRQGQYDEVAVLCFLARPSEKIVETVIEYAGMIGARLRWTDRETRLGLAANLAFVRIVGDDPELGPLADAKVLLDMQSIIDVRQAAAAS